jgi:hypothetical protein
MQTTVINERTAASESEKKIRETDNLRKIRDKKMNRTIENII